jgi:hypothetical protein
MTLRSWSEEYSELGTEKGFGREKEARYVLSEVYKLTSLDRKMLCAVTNLYESEISLPL